MPEANNDFIKVEYDSSTIADILERINSEEENGIFLPYVQRDFVWDKERIYSLLDSLMRGYPIGLIRIWETTLAVNYREFERYYRFNLANNNFFPGNANNKITKQYVLDGQQRLQSLYIAMHGSYDRKVIFFNLRSNKEEKYEFEFHSNTFTKDGWINVHDFLENPAIINELEQTPDDEMFKNAKKLHDIFKTNKNIRIEKLASDNLTDVANIFLLSNAGGVVLEPNDLIMATINAKWVTEPAKFTELINMI